MTTPRVTVPVEPLWMMHVIGPDDIYPAPDHATAVEWCAYLNQEIAPTVPGVLCVAVPAIWTGTAEEHAEGLPEAIKGWTHTLTAAPVREEGGAVVEDVADTLRSVSCDLANAGGKWKPHSDDLMAAALRLEAALATSEEAPAEAGEIDLYDDKVQAGIAWTMRQWGEALGLKTWTQGDGSESVEGDVGAEIHTILVDAGLRDPETNEMAALRAQPQARSGEGQ